MKWKLFAIAVFAVSPSLAWGQTNGQTKTTTPPRSTAPTNSPSFSQTNGQLKTPTSPRSTAPTNSPAFSEANGQNKTPTSPRSTAPTDSLFQAASQFKSLKDQASYSIGLSFGRQLKGSNLDVDAQVVARGISDALTNAKPAFTDDQINEILTAFHKQRAEQLKYEGETFLASNKRQLGVTTLPSGLQYKVLKSGTGKSPKNTDRVKVHYHGTLTNGLVFDSSVEKGDPVVFPVTGVIKGWVEALQKMRVGDKWRLFVPSELAYGEQGTPDGSIPPNTVLIFDTELLSIEPPAGAEENLPPKR